MSLLKESYNIVEMNFLYMLNMGIVSAIMFLVLYLIKKLVYNSFVIVKNFENEVLEFFWTLLPGVALVYLGIPSIELLYDMEMKNSYSLTLKIIGNQWYWSYDYVDFDNICFDSFMKPTTDLKMGEFRLLEVDNTIVLPFMTNILGIVTSNDVIHSWAIPSLHIKMDANPGRLNSFIIFSKIPGTFYGQCSEICGANHSFMPIKLEMVSNYMFKWWSLLFSEMNK